VTALVDAPVEAPVGTDAPTTGSSGAVLLRLGASRYAIPLTDVAEVAPVPPVTRLPGSPAWLPGVANWRGRMLPVLDLRPLLGADVVPLATSARLLVVSRGEVVVAIVAEMVPGVFDRSVSEIQPPPATLAGDAARLVLGQAYDGAGPFAVLDVEAVLAMRDRLDRRRS
jgi:purine-binding chemotaxis protein CheW